MTIPRLANTTSVCQFFALVLFSTTLLVTPITAGPITGNYWYMGVGQGEGVEENETLLAILSQFRPWNELPASRKALLDNEQAATVLATLNRFHNTVRNGDTFVFFYGGHSTLLADADNDDPGHDEAILTADDPISDDQLASDPYFGSFPESSTVVIIMNTCFAGGFLGGTGDLDRPAIAAKHNMLFVGTAAEDALCGPERRHLLPSINQALLQGDMNGDNQVHWSEWAATLQMLFTQRAGHPLTIWNNLDAEHDRTTGSEIPEPGSIVLLSIGSFVLLLRKLADIFNAKS
jgi:hypothetical protein